MSPGTGRWKPSDRFSYTDGQTDRFMKDKSRSWINGKNTRSSNKPQTAAATITKDLN